MEKPKVLTARELRTIMPRLSGWKLAQNKLSRTFEFQDFVQSLSFVNSLVAYFETVDHHPDVRIAYGEVTFELTRYDLGGKVTDRDVEVAKKISSLYRARSRAARGLSFPSRGAGCPHQDQRACLACLALNVKPLSRHLVVRQIESSNACLR
jgi:4a-hydroxytetrahydrobiopterin dehydratase